jgi:hypothetical protein
VHADDPVLNAMMEQAAKTINIKAHTAGLGPEKKILWAATDIEVTSKIRVFRILA